MVVREKEVMEVMSQQFIVDDKLEWKKAQNIDKKANTSLINNTIPNINPFLTSFV